MAVKNIDTGEFFITEIDKCIMVPIVRLKEDEPSGGELFSTTVTRSAKLGKFDVCINAVWYDIKKLHYADVATGDDPVPADAAINQGQALLANGKLYGNKEDLMFYAGQKKILVGNLGLVIFHKIKVFVLQLVDSALLLLTG